MKPQAVCPRGPGTCFLDQSLMSASLVVMCYLLKRESGARTAARPLCLTCACPSSKLISKGKAEAVFLPSDFFPPESYYLPRCTQWLMTCQHHSKHFLWFQHGCHFRSSALLLILSSPRLNQMNKLDYNFELMSAITLSPITGVSSKTLLCLWSYCFLHPNLLSYFHGDGKLLQILIYIPVFWLGLDLTPQLQQS